MSDVERPIYADLIALLPQAHSDEPLGNKLDRREIDALARFCSEVLCRAIEAHDAFRQEVSEVISDLLSMAGDQLPYGSKNTLSRFIIQPKTDPLQEILLEEYGHVSADADAFRAALKSRGLEIREVGE